MAGGATGRPNWLVFSPDGATVAATNLDGTVTLWDAESATVRETLRGHSGSVQQAAFSPDGATLYTASHDGTAIAWDLARDRGVVRPFTFTSDLVPDDAYYTHPGRFSPDGRADRGRPRGRGPRALRRAHARAGRGAALRHGR